MCSAKNDESQTDKLSSKEELSQVEDLVSQIFAGWAQPEGSSSLIHQYTSQEQSTLSFLGVLLEEVVSSQFLDGEVQVLSYCEVNLVDFLESKSGTKVSLLAQEDKNHFYLVSTIGDLPEFADLGQEIVSLINEKVFGNYSLNLESLKIDPVASDMSLDQSSLMYTLEIKSHFKTFPVVILFSGALSTILLS